MLDNPRIRMLALAFVSACATAGLYLLKRSDAAGELSAAATTARVLDRDLKDLAKDDASEQGEARLVFNPCARAWIEWEKSRSQANAITRGALEESISGFKKKADQADEEIRKEREKRKASEEQKNDVVVGAGIVKQALSAPAAEAGVDSPQATALTELDTTLEEAKSPPASAMPDAGPPQFWVFVATDSSLDEACKTSAAFVKRQTLKRYSPSVYSSGVHGITVVGPFTTKQDADAANAEIRTIKGTMRLAPDNFVGDLPRRWTQGVCSH